MQREDRMKNRDYNLARVQRMNEDDEEEEHGESITCFFSHRIRILYDRGQEESSKAEAKQLTRRAVNYHED